MVDIPGNNTTTATVTVGSSTTDTLEVVGDHDWFKINLTSGQEITVALDALGTNPSLDTYLIIRDAAGNILYQDDDIYPNGVDTDSLLSFAANYTGVFYIDVGAYDSDPNGPGDTAGDYRLNVTAFQQPPVGTTDQIAQQLVSGYWGDGEHPFDVESGRHDHGQSHRPDCRRPKSCPAGASNLVGDYRPELFGSVGYGPDQLFGRDWARRWGCLD